MKKSISLLLTLVVASMLIFSGCGKEVVNNTDDLRCDGIYVSTEKDDDGELTYLRFYEEGSVHKMTEPEMDPDDAYEMLNTTSNPNQLNQKVFGSSTFKINDNVIIEKTVNGVNKKTKAPDVEFTFQTNMGVNTCYIDIKGETLKMKMVTFRGRSYYYTLKFVNAD